ncbi:MAG: hypothetical protein ACOX3Q_09040 [Clostridia bacterium]|jgi:hypothetical protein|nr:hypothetical protein [Clostridiaceae bacterium]
MARLQICHGLQLRGERYNRELPAVDEGNAETLGSFHFFFVLIGLHDNLVV